MAAVAPVPAVDRAALAVARAALDAAGFGATGIQAILGTEGRLLASARQLPLHRRRALAVEGPLGPLVVLLVLGLELDADTAERALGTAALEAFAALGVLESDGATIRPRCRIVPHDDVLVASDRSAPAIPGTPAAAVGDGGALHVPGVQPPSALLARLTVRRPVAAALDMGTGCGIQAILASRHAERVVATDVNERALGYAEFNFALNGVGNVETRRGSFFEPVAGERFDLVVSNPPYVVSPENALVFRDSGLGRDRVSEQLVGELPAVLAEGGFGSMTISWIVEGDDLLEPPRRWAESTGCAAWLLHTLTHDALAAAEGWNRHLDDPEELDAGVREWLGYYERERIEALAYGCLVLRRAGPAWFRAWELPDEGTPSAGDHLLRLFAGGDVLARAGEDELLELRLALVDDASITSRASARDGSWKTEEAWLALGEGLGFRAGLDPYASALVTRLDGSRALREVLSDAAAATGSDLAVFTPPALEVTRSLLGLGFAVPAP
ncbi:MAG: methyltransferase [Gaiellaceae bacterium]